MNNRVFADTLYWVAILNPRDQWHEAAVEMRRMLEGIQLVTTESVLAELLNFFAESGPDPRNAAALMVESIIEDGEVDFIPNERDTFRKALSLYSARQDKGYSLIDCISMLAMKERGLSEVLTHDNHFEQEGFVVLL
ncbi:MAG: type II toxin-antitoxin system VapC family toxin [Pyrinomonadaceae bacterium]